MSRAQWEVGAGGFLDAPACVCPTIRAYVISLNDNWSDADRQALKPHLLSALGTAGRPKVSDRRSIMALDWTMRVQRPLWLEAAGLTEHAARLRALPEIVDPASFRAAEEVQKEAVRDARAARAAWAAWDAWDAWDARDAVPYLVAARAGDALPAEATEAERKQAGIEALNEVARKVRAAELELLDKMIVCGAEARP